MRLAFALGLTVLILVTTYGPVIASPGGLDARGGHHAAGLIAQPMDSTTASITAIALRAGRATSLIIERTGTDTATLLGLKPKASRGTVK